MLKTLASAAAALVVGAAAASADAQPVDPARFDARRAPSLAERLVLCDVSLFLATSPDLSARRMYAVRLGRPAELLLGPDFVGPGRWYDEDLEFAARRLRSRGEISWSEIDAAHRDQTREMVQRFARRGGGGVGATGEARRFLREQARFCSRFAHDLRRSS